MKIILKINEAEQYIKDRMDFPCPFDVEILQNDSVKLEPPTLDIDAMLTQMRNLHPDYRVGQKIAAIKHVREFAAKAGVHIGLASAKFFVEAV